MAGSANLPAELYADAAATFADLVGRVERLVDWSAPGLGTWDLRALVGHTSRALVTVLDYLDQPADAATIPSAEQYFALAARRSTDASAVAERGRRAGDDLGAQPALAIADLVARATTRVGVADPDAIVAVLGGGMRVREYLPTRTFEIVVHSFDIGAACGADVTFAPPVLEDVIALAGRIATAIGHGRTVLAALTGRRPLPSGFSIVT